jgi:hypothetical protein
MHEHANAHKCPPKLSLSMKDPSWSRGLVYDMRLGQALGARGAHGFVGICRLHIEYVYCLRQEGRLRGKWLMRSVWEAMQSRHSQCSRWSGMSATGNAIVGPASRPIVSVANECAIRFALQYPR